MSAFKEYTHFIPSLEVYPRVYYFNKRYNDFRDKFNKFTDKYSNLLDGKNVEAPKNCFEHGLIVKVIGKEDLDPKAFVATEPHLYKIIPSSTSSEQDADCIVPVNPHQDKVRASSASIKRDLTSSGHDAREGVAKDFDDKAPNSDKPTVIICNVTVESLNDEGSKEVKRLWNYVSSTEDTRECFLLCRSANEFTSAEEDAFRDKIVKLFKDFHLIHPIFIGTSTVEIKDDVALHLEGKLVHYFVTVQSVLQQFTKGPKGNNSSKPLLEEETVAKQIEGLFENGLVLTEKPKKDEMCTHTCNDNVISKLSHIVKCLITQPLSERNSMPVGFCNHILFKHDFERNMISKFSKEMRYHLSKFEPIVMQWRNLSVVPSKSFQAKYFHFLLDSLQNDQADVVSDMERVFKQFSTTVRKFLFEVRTCLKKTKVSIEQIKEMEQQAPKQVDTDLRKEILSLKEVYGVGTIYGRLEIHVNSEKNIEEVRVVVRDLLRKKNVLCPFIVRAIEGNVEMFADNHSTYEHGERIECSTGAAGTLAGFVDGSDEKLYGLTCAHVVKGPAEEECDVFVINCSNNQPVLFAKCLPHLIVSTGEETRPLIDLAALRVIDDMQNKCSKFLKDDNCMLNPGIIAADTTVELAGNYVYKHGAITQCTKGFVCSDDYCILSTDELDYIMLIENYDEDGGAFAQPGDSGSMICMADENEVYIVKAIGILSGGKFPAQDDTPIYFSFRLIDGLRKLTTKAGGVQFSFPKVD